MSTDTGTATMRAAAQHASRGREVAMPVITGVVVVAALLIVASVLDSWIDELHGEIGNLRGDVEQVKRDLGDVREDVAYIRGRIDEALKRRD